NADEVVLDFRVVERGRSSLAEEHADGEIEVEDPKIRDCPALIWTAVKNEDPLEVDGRQVARALNRRGAEGVGGKRHVVEARRHVDRVIVGGAGGVVVAEGP